MPFKVFLSHLQTVVELGVLVSTVIAVGFAVISLFVKGIEFLAELMD